MIACTDATNIHINHIRLVPLISSPVAGFDQCSNIFVNNLDYPEGADLLFQISGAESTGIQVRKTDISKAREKQHFTDGATAHSLNIE